MRLIDKLPQVPDLNEKSIRMITDFLFLPDKPFGSLKKGDESVLQIMGNIAFLKDVFHDNVLSKIYTYYTNIPRLIITGGINPAYTQDNEEVRLVKSLYTEDGEYDWNDVLTIPQSVIMNNRLQSKIGNPWVDEKQPLLETKSTNTKENFMAVKGAGWYKNVKHLRCLTTAESGLRVLATARKQVPELTDIGIISYAPTFPKYNLICDKENWAKDDLTKRYVYGELLRVIKYDEFGDIVLFDSEKRKLLDIAQELFEKQRQQ